MTNITAFIEGVQARHHDEESGGITDNPYSYDTKARLEWYEGYNYEDSVTKAKTAPKRAQTLGTPEAVEKGNEKV